MAGGYRDRNWGVAPDGHGTNERPARVAPVKRLTCQEVLDQLSDYLDDAARAELVVEVDQHLGTCVHCRVEVDTLRRTILIYREDEPIALTERLTTQLQLALARAYRDGCSGGGGSGTA